MSGGNGAGPYGENSLVDPGDQALSLLIAAAKRTHRSRQDCLEAAQVNATLALRDAVQEAATAFRQVAEEMRLRR